MSEPAHIRPSASNQTVADSSISGGPGANAVAGIMGNVTIRNGDEYNETTYYVQVNQVRYERRALAELCAMLEDDAPAPAYELFREQHESEYRRLVLRTISVPRAACFLAIMASRDEGYRDCAEHVGLMDSPHALALLRAVDRPLRAAIMSWMQEDHVARLLVDLTQEPSQVVSTGGRETASATDSIPTGPAGAAQILSDMAEVRADAVQTVLALQSVGPFRPAWLNDIDPAALARVLAGMSSREAAEFLDSMRPTSAANVIAFEQAGPWVEAMTREHAGQALTELAVVHPKGAAACLTRVDLNVAADLLALIAHDRDPRPAILDAMSPQLAIALLAGMNAKLSQEARRLLDTMPGWRDLVGTWPWYAATKIAFRIRHSVVSAMEGASWSQQLIGKAAATTRQWWGIRAAVAQWTSDLHDRRVRDGKVIAATAAVTVLVTIIVMTVVPPADPTLEAATTSNGNVSSVATAPPPPTFLRFPSALLANRAYWSDSECPTWSEQAIVENDSSERVAFLLLVCHPQGNDPAREITYIQYPTGTIPFKNRPTTRPVPDGEPGARVHRVLVPAPDHENSLPVWSRTDGRHGTYIEYLPDRNQSAIWLEEIGEPPTALVLFGPDPFGKTDDELSQIFVSLREVLENHGYRLQPSA